MASRVAVSWLFHSAQRWVSKHWTNSVHRWHTAIVALCKVHTPNRMCDNNIISYPSRHSRQCGYCVLTCLSVCSSVRALTWKRLELSTPNLMHVYSIAVARQALTQRSKGQKPSHTVTKTVTVARLLVTRAATAYACVDLHVDSTPMFSSYFCDHHVFQWRQKINMSTSLRQWQHSATKLLKIFVMKNWPSDSLKQNINF